MTTIVRTKPAHDVAIIDSHWNRSYSSARPLKKTISVGASSISYQSGPQYAGGHVVWKDCVHSKQQTYSGSLGQFDCQWHDRYGWYYSGNGTAGVDLRGRLPSLPAPSSFPSQELWDQLWEKIDLNSSDSVLAYSGIIQAVPLLGGLMKANTILNRIGRWATKSLRKKPFSEVLKTAIQADFIDRFVISPTLDDLRKVQNSIDYVLNIIREVHERNHAVTALRAEYQDIRSSSSGSGRTSYTDVYNPYNWADGWIPINYQWKASAGITSSIYLLAEIRYPADTLNPIKIWAQRVGLTRPLDSIWDLVPFSFVVDYFSRCGDFISHLSDQMSSVEGLKGSIASIRDMWMTSKRWSRVTASATSASLSIPGSFTRDRFIFSPGTQVQETSFFGRHPLPLEVLEKSGFWEGKGLIAPNLSTVRARTIAELFIQAKL